MAHGKTLLVALFALVTPVLLLAQHSHDSGSMKSKSKVSDADKIANAMSAGPAAITKNAAIMDWPVTADGQPRQLRAGNNGWVCFPETAIHMPGATDPMCMDKQWQAWGDAWFGKTEPKLTGTGVAYMLRGDKGASNTDPFATEQTADNHWVVTPPHVMVIYPDTKMLDGFSDDPASGGPWVMWKGTPYAHLMVPVSTTKVATQPK
ncbi:MAG: hypothetical protein ABI718_01365 [Acidobacteriota bacterium]